MEINNKGTFEFFREMWERNAELNAAEIKRRGKSLFELRGRHPAGIGLVICAGPSLDADIEILKKYSKQISADSRFRVICCDIAARRVSEIINIDYIVTLDAQKATAGYFKDLKCGGAKLIAPVFIEPEVLKNFTGEIYFYNLQYQPEQDFFNRLAKISEINCFIMCGSVVSNTAVIFSIITGMTRAIVIGNDLGFTDMKIYARGMRED